MSDSFSPCLGAIVECFEISQNVAGVTLLALGNGAPDIFSALAAVGQGVKTRGLAVAELLGMYACE